jgi:hypothetical protein
MKSKHLVEINDNILAILLLIPQNLMEGIFLHQFIHK